MSDPREMLFEDDNTQSCDNEVATILQQANERALDLRTSVEPLPTKRKRDDDSSTSGTAVPNTVGNVPSVNSGTKISDESKLPLSDRDDLIDDKEEAANMQGVDEQLMAENDDNDDSLPEEPNSDISDNASDAGRQQTAHSVDGSYDGIKEILMGMICQINTRFDELDKKVDELSEKIKTLENHNATIKASTSANDGPRSISLPTTTRTAQAIGIGLPHRIRPQREENERMSSIQSLSDTTMMTIPFNTEADYPFGVWLGDESNPNTRVRAPITPSDLTHIHTFCQNPEHMAAVLLDYLFDVNTQALSNVSGTGRPGVQQLDPLMIYGIRCHLRQRFNISMEDWQRIKNSIDVKCSRAYTSRNEVPGPMAYYKAVHGAAVMSASSLMDNSDRHDVHGMPILQLIDSHNLLQESRSAMRAPLYGLLINGDIAHVFGGTGPYPWPPIMPLSMPNMAAAQAEYGNDDEETDDEAQGASTDGSYEA